jgi:hypothetical protein
MRSTFKILFYLKRNSPRSDSYVTADRVKNAYLGIGVKQDTF